MWDALETGRAYVAFDWIADPRGIDFAGIAEAGRHEMGSRVPFADGLHLAGKTRDSNSGPGVVTGFRHPVATSRICSRTPQVGSQA